MRASPPVSVIIPAYNHARFAGAAIESVLAQHHGDFELLVVDDASRDDTWQVIATFADPRIRRMRHETNQGAHATLNEAIAASTGRCVAVLNSDDRYAPNRLGAMLEAAAAADDPLFLAFSDVAFIDAEGRPADDDPRAQDYRRLHARCAAFGPHLWFLTGNPVVSTSNLFFSRALFERTGGFAGLRYTHDWDWCARAARHCSPRWLAQPLVEYRVHGANTLSEDDGWRHIHENSYLQSAALMRLQDAGAIAPADREAATLALLQNDSLHPLGLLCFLAWRLAGTDDAPLLDRATIRNGAWPLAAVAQQAGVPERLFQSRDRLADAWKTVAEQAAMLDERLKAIQHMDREIADRDRWIEDLNGRLAELAGVVEARDRRIGEMSDEMARLGARLKAAEDELAALHASRLVRAALGAGRGLRRIGIGSHDPRLREH